LPYIEIYAEWISIFGNDGYDALVQASTNLLDELVGDDEHRIPALMEIFDRSIRFEVEFWDMAYAGRPT